MISSRDRLLFLAVVILLAVMSRKVFVDFVEADNSSESDPLGQNELAAVVTSKSAQSGAYRIGIRTEPQPNDLLPVNGLPVSKAIYDRVKVGDTGCLQRIMVGTRLNYPDARDSFSLEFAQEKDCKR
jgi:hypothetical protein